MADLLDIVPATAVEVVHIADNQRIKVRGLPGSEIAAIVARFPNVVAVLTGAAGDNAIALYGMACGPIIAAGCGHPGNEKERRLQNSLLLEDQAKLIKAIIGLSFPNGFGPIMETIATLMTGAADEKSKPVRVRLKTSQSASPPSSDADSHRIMQ